MAQRSLNRWNQFDEFGLLVGLGQFGSNGRQLIRVRKPGETNRELYDRIRDAYTNVANSSKQGLINGISRDLDLTRYNLVGQNVFLLTREIDPTRSSEVTVYKKDGEEWVELSPRLTDDKFAETGDTPYSTASSGWILWQNDNTKFTRIVEILTDLDNETPIKIEYPYLNENDESYMVEDYDLDTATEYEYMYYKEETPNESVSAVIYTPEEFGDEVEVTSPKYSVVADILTRPYKLEWGQFSYDEGRWDADLENGRGNIPTIYDAALPTGTISSYFDGGIEFDDDLALKDLDDTSTGWYPMINTGAFYVDEVPYYLFENRQELIMNATGVYAVSPWTDTSGYYPGSGYMTDFPAEGSMIILTDGSGTDSDQYVAITYDYPTGSGESRINTDKWRLIPWASGVMDNWEAPSGTYIYWIDYELATLNFLEPVSGYLTMEYEDVDSSGTAILSYMNLDPNLSANVDERFLVMDNYIPSTTDYKVTLEYSGPPVSNGTIDFKINVYDSKYEEPLSGVPVRVEPETSGIISGAYVKELGSVTSVGAGEYAMTDYDGSAYYGIDIVTASRLENFYATVSGVVASSTMATIYIGS